MVMPAYEYEFESEFEDEFELESEFESELEGEYEGEYEGEEFLGSLGRLASRAVRSPQLRRLGLQAARSAVRRTPLAGLSGLIPEGEYEGEYEYEDEFEYEAAPASRAQTEALMEHLAHAARTAQSEAEAEAFLPALIPLAARLLPMAARALPQVTPQLTRSISQVVRTLRSDPSTRPLVQAVPAIVRRTTSTIAQQAAQGQPVTAQGAARTLARHTAQVLSNPQQAAQAVRRSRAADRRFHRGINMAARPAAARIA